jgi:GT2 family glycosyltransferase
VKVEDTVKTVVSIVTWRAGKLTVDCLASLAAEMRLLSDTRVIVIDNNSGDGTAETIEQAIVTRGWSQWARLIRSPVNGGFASGNNITLRHALSVHPAFRYLLLLNPDTEARPGAIRTLIAFMDESRSVGIAGGRCEDPDGTPQECSFRFPGLLSEFADQFRLGVFDNLISNSLVRTGIHERPVKLGWVSGALMAIRREVFDAIGFMDEGYFLYFEETDFTLRALRSGWTTWHVPDARVVHHVGQLTGVRFDGNRPARLPKYWFESRRRYFVLNHGLLFAIAIDLLVLTGNALWTLRRIVQQKPPTDPPYWIADLLTHGVLRRGRRRISPRQIS